jgi:hypothetical protein
MILRNIVGFFGLALHIASADKEPHKHGHTSIFEGGFEPMILKSIVIDSMPH